MFLGAFPNLQRAVIGGYDPNDIGRKEVVLGRSCSPSEILERLSFSNIRKECIDSFIDKYFQKVNAPLRGWVKITDVCKSICNDLSPSASYIICTGERPSIARRRMDDSKYKQKELARYIIRKPHKFEIKGYAEQKTGAIAYMIGRVLVDLTADSDGDY
jgi:hypothetical protein